MAGERNAVAMSADRAGWANGSITPDDLIVLDQQIRAREQEERAAKPTAVPKAPPVSETFTENDLEAVLPRGCRRRRSATPVRCARWG
jgi:hypothetical protein